MPRCPPTPITGRDLLVVVMILTLLLNLALMATASSSSRADWPGESCDAAMAAGGGLAALDPAMQLEISGVHWNPLTEALWVTAGGNDGKGTWMLSYNSSGHNSFSVAGFWSDPRDEDITQAILEPQVQPDGALGHQIYITVEDDYTILQAMMVTGRPGVVTASWQIPELQPKGKRGAEGLVFVPDRNLVALGFVDGAGQRYSGSQGGLGGLMLVGHQDGGYVYAFDLAAGDFRFAEGRRYRLVGGFATAATETSSMAFDRSIGRLYISHQLSSSTNYVEITDLSSVPVTIDDRPLITRQFNHFLVYNSPDCLKNPEGVAVAPFLVPQPDGKTLVRNPRPFAFYGNDAEKDDSDHQKQRAVMWFQHFAPTPAGALAAAAWKAPRSDRQIGAINEPLADRLDFTLIDAAGYPVAHTTVTCVPHPADGRVSSPSVTTDIEGYASCGQWTLPAAVGYHYVEIHDAAGQALAVFVAYAFDPNHYDNSTNPFPDPDTSSTASPSRPSLKLILGIVVGVILVVAAIAGLLLMTVCRDKFPLSKDPAFKSVLLSPDLDDLDSEQPFNVEADFGSDDGED